MLLYGYKGILCFHEVATNIFWNFLNTTIACEFFQQLLTIDLEATPCESLKFDDMTR